MPRKSVPPLAMRQRLHVGALVRALREEQGLSQERLAALAGISRYSVYRTELATHSVSLDHLTMIAKALKVPLGSLVLD